MNEIIRNRRFHVKKNDEVVVIAGAEKGKRGRVISIVAKKDRVIVEGVRMLKKHERGTRQTPGRIVEREGTIHISNVMKAEAFDARAAKRAPAAPNPA